MLEQKAELNDAINMLAQYVDNKFKRLKEITDQDKSAIENKIGEVNDKIVALEGKFSDLPRQAVVLEPHASNAIIESPSVGNQSNQLRASSCGNTVQADESRTCSCRSTN
jgi:predicted nuclease with TOPRIM domain